MAQQTVDTLHSNLHAVFDAFRHRLALSDYSDTVLAAVALKAAEERARYIEVLSARHLLPGATSLAKLTPPESPSPGWSDLIGLSPVALATALANRRRVVEEREPSLAGALGGLDAGTPATQGDMLQLLVHKLAPISLDPSTFEVSWAFGAALDRIILQLAHAERRHGEYSTRRGVARLIAGLADLGPALAVHDPAVGAGRLLVECARRLTELGHEPDSLRLTGTENNPSSWALGRILLWSCGLDARGVSRADALEPSSDGPFDRVVCDVPSGGTNVKVESLAHLALKSGTRLVRLEDAFLALSRGLLAREGRAVVFLPQGSLFRAQSAAARRNLIEDRLLRAVVQMPAGLMFGTAITTAILVIDHRGQDRVVFVDAQSAAWDADTGDLPTADIEDILGIVAGKTGRFPARHVPYEELIATPDFNLSPERFLGSQHQADLVFASQEIDNRVLDSREIVLVKEQRRALEEIASGLAEGAVVNLVGPRGAGKTTVLRLLREQLTGATVVAIGLGTLETGGLVSRLRRELSSWKGREGRLVLLLDDWESAASIVAEQEVADFQRLIYIVASRGPGSGVVLVSELPVADLQAYWSREILPRSVVGSMKTVALWSFVSQRLEQFEKQMRQIDFSKIIDVLGPDFTKQLSAYFHSPDWERFLQELTSRQSWLSNESRVLGFDLDHDRGELGAFLIKANLLPEEFVSQLLRPSDIRDLFPDLEHLRDRPATIREAFQRWKTQENGRE